MLSTHDIAEQLQSIHASIAMDEKAIEIYRQCAGSDLKSPLSLQFLQLIATVQGTVATKQLQATMLQLGLRQI